MINLKPFINIIISTKTRYFYSYFTNLIIKSYILIPDSNLKQITDIHDIKFKSFAPCWLLAFVLLRFIRLLSQLKLNEWFHTTESVSIAGQLCLSHFKGQLTAS